MKGYELVKPEKRLALSKPKPLSSGQQELYKLLCDTLNGKTEKVARPDIINIYNKTVRRSEKRYEDYHKYDHENKRWIGSYVEYEDWRIEMYAEMWFIRALGALIRKGYITVIPLIDLSRPEIKEPK